MKLFKNIFAIFLILTLSFGGLFVNRAQAVTYKVPHFLSSISSISSGVFLPVFSGHGINGNATESRSQVEMTFSGTFSDFQSSTRSSNTSGTTTYTLRKNGVDTAITWTVPQSATGQHGDAVDTVTFVSGDVFSISVVTSAGSVSELTGISFKIESDDGKTRQVIGTYDPTSVNFTTVPRYARPAGQLLNSLTTDLVSQNEVHNASLIEAISVNVISNLKTVATTFKPRVNGTTSSLTATAPASTAGIFTTSGGSVSLAVDDLFNTEITASSSTNAIGISYIALTIVSDNDREISLYHGNDITRPTADTANDFNMIGNRMSTSPTELAYAVRLKAGGVLSRMSMYVSADTATTDLVVRLRVNGVDGNQQFTQSNAGWLTDTTNTDTIDDNDYVTFRTTRTAIGTGNTTIRANSALFTMDEILDTFLPQIIVF